MLEGRFFLELSPDLILCGEGPWFEASPDAEWGVAILPFKPLEGVRPSFLTAASLRLVDREGLAGSRKPDSPRDLQWMPSPREEFSRAFDGLQRLIQGKKAQKGVPWAAQSAPLPNARPQWEKLLPRVRALGKELAAYGAELAGESVLGASPEWLFRLDAGGRVLHTMAVAGTRWAAQKRESGIEEKEQHEHRLVVDDIVSRLDPHGDVVLGDTAWAKAGALEHLRTPITLRANRALDPLELVERLHPTPAVGVFPRSDETRAWLDALPGHETRADFAAPWVVRHRDGRAWALVGIRQVRLRENHVWVPAGCGVVAGSEEGAEWDEIQAKIHSVREGWGLA